MDFKKFLPKSHDSDKKEYYWSVIIEPGWVQAGIWRIEGDKAQVVLHSPPFSWEVEEDLVQAADNALSAAIQGFPETLVEPQKTVFGVTSSWVSEGNIKNEYLAKIKVVCSELTLTPIGFVVLPEAIAHLIKAEEGSPLNSVVLGVYKDILEITYFKLGNLLGTTEVSRSVSVVDDVVEGLARFGVKDPIPSRILLYNGREGELEDVRQSLLKVNWEDDTRLKFLHTPKVEVVGVKEKIFAVSLAGASELASVTSVEVGGNLKEAEEEPLATSQVSTEEEFSSDEESLTPEDLGFALERDVAESSETLETQKEIKQEISPYETGEMDDRFKKAELEGGEAQIDEIHRNVEPPGEKVQVGKGMHSPKFNFGKVGLAISKLKQKILSFKSPSAKKPTGLPHDTNKMLVYGGVFLIALILLGGVAWWILPKATVTVYVSPKQLGEEFTMSVDVTGSTSDFSSRELAGELVEVEVQGDKTKQATGTKTVGEKATGEVTLYRVGTEITIPAATILHGPNELRFSLDEEVTVASGSAGKAGTAKVSVVAEDIGADYNLAAGTSFSVGNFTTTDLEAENENAFSGGSSREITAVSQEDLDSLEEELTQELEGNAKNQLTQKVAGNQILIEESVATTTTSRAFSNKEGDEAENLKLSLGVRANAVSIKKEEIVTLASEILKDKVPEGFVLRGDQIDFEFNLEGEESGVYEFEVRVSANLVPEVNTETIRTRIRGRNPELAEEYLNREVPGFVRAEIKIRPSLPVKLRTLPHLAKNIEVEVAADR